MKFVKLLSTVGILSIPISFTISCNENIDTKLNKLLSNDNILNVEINVDAIKQATGKETIEIRDIITENVEVVKIVNSQNLINWNNSLSENDKEIYEVKPEIKSFVLPQMTSDGIINELEVIVDVSTGPVRNKTIRKNLSNISDISNKIVLNENNVFEPSTNSNGDIRNNKLWTSFKDNVLLYLKTKGINNSLSNDDLTNKLKFKFPTDTNVLTNGYIAYQKNLYCAFNEKVDNGIYVYIYTNNEDISNTDDIAKKCIAIRMFLKFEELRT